MEFDYILSVINNYGYLAIFLGLALGIIGLPIPDEFGMTFIGAAVAAKTVALNIWLVYLSALSGSICGITVSYLLGRKLGYSLIRRYGHYLGMTEARLIRTQQFFTQWGSWILPAGYFMPGIRHFSAYVTGISKMPFSRFTLFAYLGATFWCATFVGGGYWLGERAIAFLLFIHDNAQEVAVYAITIVGIALIIWYWRSPNKKKSF